MNRDEIKKRIREIELTYDYHSYNNTYDTVQDLDTLTDLVMELINKEVAKSKDVQNKKSYYAVEQYDKNLHEHRWIFEKDSPIGNEIDYANHSDEGYRIYSGNDCIIREVHNEEEIRSFLTGKAHGVDSENPDMAELAEYYLTVDTDFDSCTDIFLKKLGLKQEELTQYDDRCEEIDDFVKQNKEIVKEVFDLTDADLEDFFYGDNTWKLKYSDIIEKVEEKKKEDIEYGLD